MQKLLLLVLVIFLSASCSKQPGHTSAKVRLKLGAMFDLTSGVGSGGAILFGRSSTGNIFGKRIVGAEENLDLPNGSWVFYSVMWDSSSTPMNGKAYCGKSAQNLTGTDVSISLNLSNANCVDAEFSEGRNYTSGGFIKFADLFAEECDEVGALTPFFCGLENQGSGTSYRLKFQSFRKSPVTGYNFEGDPIVSDCRTPSSMHNAAFPVNFPSGSVATPFVVTMEIFLNSPTCNTADPKGVYQLTLNQGLRSEIGPNHKIVVSNSIAAPSPTTPDFAGAAEDNQKKCENLLGSWSGSSCSGIPLAVTRFTPAPIISSQAVTTSALKHLFQIPKSFLCDRYLNSNTVLGTHPFAAGEGSVIRPYKICTEWQINQIGEQNSAGFSNNSFKLMNDLDMNKVGFNSTLQPLCVGVVNSVYDRHHNFNSFDQATIGGCLSSDINASPVFTGRFNGNLKTISNARITNKSVTNIGMVRNLGVNGVIKNLKLLNLEVRGASIVGGIAGSVVDSSNAKISNITLTNTDIESEGVRAGAIAGTLGSTATISGVRVVGAEVRGTDFVGGLVGESSGLIEKSMFRGEMDQHYSGAGYIGGVVGYAGGASSINSVFSEGSITTSLQFAGGVTGSNAGTIVNAYSTMYIKSYFQNANARLGGITAENTNSISNVYSDVVLDYTGGGATPAFDGISAQGSVPTACLTTGATTVSGCTFKAHADLRNGTNFPADPNWKSDVNLALPRLAWEDSLGLRSCLSLANLTAVGVQLTSGRGVSSADPVILCTSDQVKNMGGVGSTGKYFKLAEDISISDWTVPSLVLDFLGILDGNNFSLYGLNLTIPGSNSNYGIVRTNSGSILNLNLLGNKIVKSGSGSDTGILTGNNIGLISKVIMLGNTIDGIDSVGSIAGSNSGVIKDSSADDGVVRGQSYVGGIVGYNTGTLQRLSSSVSLSDLAAYPAYFKFGGIAGASIAGATIDQVEFDGNINMINISSASASQIYTGGLVGFNDGILSNSLTRNYSTMTLKNSQYVGGLVGANSASGVISKSFALGKQIYSNGNNVLASSTFNPIAGINNGTIVGNTFYLNNNIGSMLQGTQTSSNCTGSGTQNCITVGFFDSINANFFTQGFGGGGNSLTTMIPMLPPAILPITGSITSASTTITLTSSAGVIIGMSCVGAGIPVGAIVTNIVNGTDITIDVPAFATGPTIPLSFYNRSNFSFLTADVGGSFLTSGTNLNFYAGHTPASTVGSSTIGDFTNITKFSDYDISYDTGDINTSVRYARLMEYYRAMMENRPPTLTPPVWDMEDGEGYPRLLQLDH